MAHKTEIIKHEQVGDERIAVRIRCCGDAKTDSTMTISKAHRLTAEQIEAKVDAFHDAVAAKHNGMKTVLTHIQNLKTKTKDHPEKK